MTPSSFTLRDADGVVSDRDAIQADIERRLAAARTLGDPKKLADALQEPFRDSVRVLICNLLVTLRDQNPVLLDFARRNYSAEFANLLRDIGIRDTFGMVAVREDPGQSRALDPKLAAEIDELLELAEQADPGFQSAVAKIATELDCWFEPGPIKSRNRIHEKSVYENNGDIYQVKDIIRNRVITDGAPTEIANQLIESMEQAGFRIASDTDPITGITWPLVSNRYLSEGQLRWAKDIYEYIDIKVRVEARFIISTGEGMILGEVVIASSEMATATRIEHSLYEIRRTILNQLRIQDIIEIDSPQQRLLTNLDEIKENFYNLVATQEKARTSYLK